MNQITKIILLLAFAFCVQGCSYLHRFEIKNPTDAIWNVEYEIKDSRGIFRNKVSIKNENSKEDKPLLFEGNIVNFLLHPDETANLFWIRNTCYKVYKKDTRFDAETPWKTFMNVKKIKITSGENKYQLDPLNLEKVFDKNSRRLARINIEKIVKYYESLKP